MTNLYFRLCYRPMNLLSLWLISSSTQTRNRCKFSSSSKMRLKPRLTLSRFLSWLPPKSTILFFFRPCSAAPVSLKPTWTCSSSATIQCWPILVNMTGTWSTRFATSSKTVSSTDFSICASWYPRAHFPSPATSTTWDNCATKATPKWSGLKWNCMNSTDSSEKPSKKISDFVTYVSIHAFNQIFWHFYVFCI